MQQKLLVFIIILSHCKGGYSYKADVEKKESDEKTESGQEPEDVQDACFTDEVNNEITIADIAEDNETDSGIKPPAIEDEPEDSTLPGKKSIKFLPSCNGYTCIVYRTDPEDALQGHRVKSFREHIYKNPEKDIDSRQFLYDFYFGIKTSKGSFWLSEINETYVSYIRKTNIIHVTNNVAENKIDAFYFTPMTEGQRTAVFIIHAQGAGISSFYSLINVHAGGIGENQGEIVKWDAQNNILIEKKGNYVFGYKSILPFHAFTAGNPNTLSNPYSLLKNGKDYNNEITGLNDISCGFEWNAEKDDFWAGVIITMRDDGDETKIAGDINSFYESKKPDEILNDEIKFWDDYLSFVKYPSDISVTEKLLYSRSVIVLTTAQVMEKGSASGQIVASLPWDNPSSSSWNVTWVRDGVYATRALLKSGLTDQAENSIIFFLNSTAGLYKTFVGKDYLISVCRYFGNGVEESDDNGFGYNIEFDNFGLFLQAYSELAQISSLEYVKDKIKSLVADVLISLIESDLHILKPDSSIWERHWNEGFPNGKKHFTYSTVNAIHGLRTFGEWINFQSPDDGKSYISGSDELLNGLKTQLIKDDVLVSSFEEKSDPEGKYIDGAVVEAINYNLVSDAVAQATLKAFEKYLKISNGGPGFKRNDDGTGTANPFPWYDDQEWIFIDLRIASAYCKSGMKEKGKELIDWVTGNASKNYYLIPELLTADKGEYAGSMPMTGFGAGAYILSLWDCF
jgi:GH15 family glucan-1,4-alpha-glucosidase